MVYLLVPLSNLSSHVILSFYPVQYEFNIKNGLHIHFTVSFLLIILFWIINWCEGNKNYTSTIPMV